ncbi:MAG: protein BatD, partial [Verrucomicrobiaceae bacterium]
VTVMSCLFSTGDAAEVEAQLDRQAVPAGEGALLTLKIMGNTDGPPAIPEVENLILQPRGRSQQIQIFNGQRAVTTTHTFVVGSRIPGDYQVPAIEVTIAGLKYQSQPLNLKVLEAGAAQPPPAPPQPGQPDPTEEEPAADAGEKQFGFLTVDLADNTRKHAYVGEIAPVRIRAWLPQGARVQLHSGIQPEGKGFTLHNVSERPQESQETRDGKTYSVVTWFGGISATRAGKFPASLSVDATVAIRDPSAQRRRRGGPFDDPFFGNMFDDTPMIQKQVTLKSDDHEIEIRPLPAEGKPAGFTGAVGEFKFDTAEIPGTWKTGEPQQITTQLSGSGNFALMKAPDLAPAEAWKSYPGKDQFRASDETSFSGSKVFQFSAVPRKGGDQDVSLSFSYFDPEAEAYKTIASPVQKIRITGEDVAEDKPADAPAVKEPEKKKTGELVAQRRNHSPSATLVPLVARRAFKEMLGTSAGLCLLGAGLAVARRRRTDPRRASKAALEKDTREALEKAGAARDSTAFFVEGRLAIQRQLGALWNQPPQAITTSEVQARLSADSPVVRFFREADVLEYSRGGDGEVQSRWRELLDEALASLTPSTR